MIIKWLKKSVWIIILALLLLSFGRSILMARRARQDIYDQTAETEALRQEVQQLEQTVKEATSSYELERRVREELKLQRPDEVIIELPDQPL
jgi:cell division protein FtsB